MLKQENLRLSRKLFILLALLGLCMGFADSIGVKEAHALICCSACETDPPPRPCNHGCSPSC
jgi:hypothetical protein